MLQDLIKRGAIFYVSHSGGKDSQCMFDVISQMVPSSQIVVIHAHLPGVEWPGTREHIADTINGCDYLEVKAVKTFFEMVNHRGMWPAPKYRQCTSDLKRGPIQKAIRRDLKARGKKLAVSCLGLRAQESPFRAKATVLKEHKKLSKAGREVYEYLPIHDYLVEKVFDTIGKAGQKPHYAYAEGMERLSCCFCIMASKNDLTVSARCNPELYKKYVLKEEELNFTLRNGGGLESITGIRI